MAFPTVSARTETQLASGTSLTIDFVQTTGERVIVLLGLSDTAQALATIGDGFTDLTATNATFHILTKVLDGSEGGNVVVTVGSATKGAALAYNIADHAPSIVPVISTVATGTSTGPDPGNLVPAGGAKDFLWIASFRQNGEEADDDTWCNSAPATPSAFGNLIQKTSATAGLPATNGSVAAADLASNASSMDPGAFSTDQSLAWRAYTIAVYPIQTTSFTANAVIAIAQSASLTANAVLKREQSATLAADAIARASRSATFSADAVLRATVSSSYAADAIQLKTATAGYNADAVILTGRLDGYTADAVTLSPQGLTLSADAFIAEAALLTLTADAVILGEQVASISSDAITQVVQQAAVSADAVIEFSTAASFTADAVLSPTPPPVLPLTVDAWIVDLHFDFIVMELSAQTITATISMEATVVASSFSADAVIA